MQSCEPAVAVFDEGQPFHLPIPRRATRADPLAHAIHSGFIMGATVNIDQRGKVREKRGVGGGKKIGNVRHV